MKQDTNEIIKRGVTAKRYKGFQTVVENNLITFAQVDHFIKRSLRLKLEASAERNGFLIGRCWYANKKWNYYVDRAAFDSSSVPDSEEYKTQAEIKKLEQLREDFIDKYILPIETKLERLRDQLTQSNNNGKATAQNYKAD